MSEVGKGKTSIINDIFSDQSIKTEPIDIPDPFLDSLIVANEEAVAGAEIAGGATGIGLSEAAAVLVPELGAALIVGGVLYGIQKGVEVP